MKVNIVLIHTNVNNAHKVVERIKNETFDTTRTLRNRINLEAGLANGEEVDEDDVLIYPLTDFIDAVNNQEIDNLTEYFMSNVNFI